MQSRVLSCVMRDDMKMRGGEEDMKMRDDMKMRGREGCKEGKT